MRRLPPPSQWSDRVWILLLSLSVFFLGAWIHPNDGANQFSRLTVLHSLYADQSFAIDRFQRHTGDKAFYEGHYYSDKAPGGILLGMPAFAIGGLILRAYDIPIDWPEAIRPASWIGTKGSVTLLASIASIALYAIFRRFAKPGIAFLAALSVSVGTVIFPYSTMMFSHATAASLFAIALALVFVPMAKTSRRPIGEIVVWVLLYCIVPPYLLLSLQTDGSALERFSVSFAVILWLCWSARRVIPGMRQMAWVRALEHMGMASFRFTRADEIATWIILAFLFLQAWRLELPFEGPAFVFVITLFCSALLWLVLVAYASSRPSGNGMPARMMLAGVIAGIAVLTEYPSVFGAAGLGAFLLFSAKRERVLWYGLGAILPAAVLFTYHYVCFGSPLTTGYAYTTFVADPNLIQEVPSVWGYAIPSPSMIYFMLFSPYRGLFFWSPVMLLALIGIVPLLRTHRAFAVMLLGVITLQILFVSRLPMPSGGAAVGPRHLVAIIPFMGPFLVVGFKRFPAIGILLGSLSILLMLIVTLTDPMPWEYIRFPLTELHLKRLLAGEYQATLWQLFGVPAWIVPVFFFVPASVLVTLGIEALAPAPAKPPVPSGT